MAQYIDKSALVAEIEKCYSKCLERAKITDYDYWNGKADAYRNVLTILTTSLEVEEVDLEKEVKYILNQYYYFPEESIDIPTVIRITAKHFFELGLNAREENKL